MFGAESDCWNMIARRRSVRVYRGVRPSRAERRARRGEAYRAVGPAQREAGPEHRREGRDEAALEGEAEAEREHDEVGALGRRARLRRVPAEPVPRVGAVDDAEEAAARVHRRDGREQPAAARVEGELELADALQPDAHAVVQRRLVRVQHGVWPGPEGSARGSRVLSLRHRPSRSDKSRDARGPTTVQVRQELLGVGGITDERTRAPWRRTRRAPS